MWEAEYTDEFAEWWESLSEDVQEAIAYDVGVLEQVGRALAGPPLTRSLARSFRT
jgi:hypothetical protein